MATRSWPELGPVFAYEWLTASRRWQGYALRSLLVLLLLLGIWGVWLGHHDGTGDLSVRQLAEIGRGFYAVTTLILLGLVGLAAPAAAAGAICLDKDRGNLTLLFSTDLTDAEIVLGKLAARLVPVLGLIACATPVLALATLFGGVDPAMPTGAILVCLACGVFGCTLALTLSVWGRKTHEVLLATYAFGIFWLLSAPIWAGLVWTLPWWARPAWLPGSLALVPYNPETLNRALPGAPGIGGVISGVHVSAGLLLLSISAVTSLAEERQGGSLDVLLATPLSTRSIVLGKWWGAFRGVPPLTVLPVLIAAAMATHTGFALGPVLIGGLVVAYGAAITSLGLALATWLPRMDRAIGLTAGLYVVVLIAAVPVGMIFLNNGPNGAGPGLASASPFWGVGYSSALFGGNAGSGHAIGRHAAWLVLWIVAYGLIAFGLLLATLKTFNGCLGRFDGQAPGGGPFPRPARKPATWLPDAEPALDLDLRPRPAAPLSDPLASDH